MLRSVQAVRYVMPFREGGSVPALVEADDLGMYVVKLRGAAQGAKALVAELVSGEIARAVGLDVPELVLVELDEAMAASEPDPEICLPLEASVGTNLGLDYLPASVTFDPVGSPSPDALLASKIVLFDAFVANVDRTVRNTNLLFWHKKLWLIDHGASLWFHHGWSPEHPLDGADDPFAEVKDHVLLRWANELDEAAKQLTSTVTPSLIGALVAAIPESWLEGDRSFESADAQRSAYAAWLTARIQTIPAIVEEARRARAHRV